MTTAAHLLAPSRATTRAGGARYATGFDPLDLVTGGFRAHDLAIVGGRPGVGKTVAALQWAREMAMRGQTVVYVSYDHAPAALVRRLLAIELRSLARPDELSELARLRTIGQEVALGATAVGTLTADPLGEEATLRLREYGSRIHLVRPADATTGANGIAELVAEHATDATALVVDSIQGVKTPAAGDDLKALAMAIGIPVVGLSGVDRAGLTARRVRMHHLDAPSALVHAADVVVMLNDKDGIVEDPRPQAAHWVVFSVEKNRDGVADLDLEFRKDLANFRFDPAGGFLTEALVDGGTARVVAPVDAPIFGREVK